LRGAGLATDEINKRNFSPETLRGDSTSRRWETNFTMGVKGMRHYVDVDWSHLAEDIDCWLKN
jgi:hypothetical protein